MTDRVFTVVFLCTGNSAHRLERVPLPARPTEIGRGEGATSRRPDVA